MRDPAAELALLLSGLCPGGWLHIVYGAEGPTGPSRVLTPIAAALRVAGFRTVTVRTDVAG